MWPSILYFLLAYVSLLSNAACKHSDKSTVHGESHRTHDGATKRDQEAWTHPDDPQHFPTLIIKTSVPASPGAVGNLMFTAHGPLMDFWTLHQGFQDVQSGGWHPQTPDGSMNLLSRNTSFVVNLPNGFGPKQARIEVTDTGTANCCNGFSQTTLSTMRAPHIKHGHSFVVKLRTDITPEGTSQTHLLVTATVEWSGASSIAKSFVEEAAFSGLRQYFQDIVAFMKDEIVAHKEEYRQIDLDAMNYGPEECMRIGFPCSPPRHEGTSQGERKTQSHNFKDIELEHRVDSLEQKLYELGQELRRIETRLIREEDSIATLEEENRTLKRILEEIGRRT